MELRDRLDLPAARLAEVRAAIAGHGLLGDLIRWGARAQPQRLVVDVIVQDEYTYDVVLDFGGGLFLVYDTT